MVDILAAILNLLKSSMMPAQHHLDYLTLKHHPTTKLSINNYKQNINYINIDNFQKKMHFGGHIGGHFMILYDVSLSLFKISYSSTSSNRINNNKKNYILHCRVKFEMART